MDQSAKMKTSLKIFPYAYYGILISTPLFFQHHLRVILSVCLKLTDIVYPLNVHSKGSTQKLDKNTRRISRLLFNLLGRFRLFYRLQACRIHQCHQYRWLNDEGLSTFYEPFGQFLLTPLFLGSSFVFQFGKNSHNTRNIPNFLILVASSNMF